MLLASNELALIEAVPLRVLAVSCACSLASAVANLNEYHVLTFLLRYRRIAQVREARVYQRTAEWFSAAPFLVIAVVGFLPIPVDVIRWLAVICRYSRWRFLVAYFIGRTPRYALFAASAVWFDLGWLQIMVIQAVLILLATAKVVYPHIRRRSDSR
ncbi:MAG: hypothetical protein GY842_20970 [bacterium]|nr:hypothetical protein [bacterium]